MYKHFNLYVYTYIYTHTHTHTYIYVQFEDIKYEIYSDILFHISGNIHRCGGKSVSHI